MPLWRIFSHPDTFSPAQRDALAQSITDLYVSRGLPAFYVDVLFIDVDEHHTYVGGKKKSNFVRIAVEQIARKMPDPSTSEGSAYRKSWMDRINEALKAQILDRKELNLELHVAETPFDLWRIDGLDPPPANSDGEKLWREENKAVPWQN